MAHANSNSSKFAKKFCAKSPFKSGIGDVHAQQRKNANLEPLLGTKKNINGKVDYDMGEEFDAKVDKERKNVKGTKYQPGFESHQTMRKDQLKK
jgi:hypothetical protein